MTETLSSPRYIALSNELFVSGAGPITRMAATAVALLHRVKLIPLPPPICPLVLVHRPQFSLSFGNGMMGYSLLCTAAFKGCTVGFGPRPEYVPGFRGC
jgi:hypothetical protein